MKCKICSSKTKILFNTLVLNKHNVEYYQCTSCDFIQTETPYWLNEAYVDSISPLDTGYVRRNLYFSLTTYWLIKKYFNKDQFFLDYGGGYGMFVRLMRDRGLNFFRQDKYCENLFVKYFDVTDHQINKKFELITTFEVFEHLVEPLSEIEYMLNLSDSILFSTELQPSTSLNTPEDWWYFVPETGQHIAFYSKKSLELIAKKFNCNIYSNKSLHLLTKKEFKYNPLKKIISRQDLYLKFLNKFTPKEESLNDRDWHFVQQMLRSKDS